MKIVAIADIHGTLPEDLPDGDVLTISGDICPDFMIAGDGGPIVGSQRNWLKNHFLRWCDKLIESGKFCDIVFVAGNHDFVFEKPIKIQHLNFKERVHYLQDSSVTIDGVNFYGLPWCTFCGAWAFMGSKEALERKYSKIPEGTDVLLSHGPVKGYGDDVESYNVMLGMKEIEHVGSKSLLDNVIRVMPRYVCTGHIHCGSHREFTLDLEKPVTIVNVAILNDHYKNMYSSFEFEI